MIITVSFFDSPGSYLSDGWVLDVYLYTTVCTNTFQWRIYFVLKLFGDFFGRKADRIIHIFIFLRVGNVIDII